MSIFIITILLILLLIVSGLYFKTIYDQKKLIYKSEQYQKGIEFENEVFEEIKRVCPGAKVLRNIIIPKDEGGSTEIDMLLITNKGLFVIECKNYNGFVVGRKENKKWAIYYTKKTKRTFYSPIFQNIGHIFALRDMFPKYFFHNVVIFNNDVRLCKEVEQLKEVYTFDQFFDFILKTLPTKRVIYTQAEIESMYNFLSPLVNHNKKEHIEYLKKLNLNQIKTKYVG